MNTKYQVGDLVTQEGNLFLIEGITWKNQDYLDDSYVVYEFRNLQTNRIGIADAQLVDEDQRIEKAK